MRIVLITSKLNFETAGGSVIDIHLKAKGLVELGHEVAVVTAYSSANIIKESLPYTVFEEQITALHFVKIQYQAYALIKKYERRADVFYIDGNHFVYSAGFYKLRGGKVSIVAFFNIRLACWADTHGNKEERGARLKRRIRFFIEHYFGVPLANRVDTFIFNTPMVEKMYSDFGYKKPSYILEDFVATEEIIQRESAISMVGGALEEEG